MNRFTKTTTILVPALLIAAVAQAQVVFVPGRVGVLPVSPIPVITIPNAVPTVPVLPRPADIPVLPVPALPGVPMFRLEDRAVAAQAHAAPAAVAVAAPAARAAAKVDEKKAAPIQGSAPVRSIQRARRGFGLNGKHPDARGLQALFDGSKASDLDGIIAIVEEIERPQTLPESDLLAEIGPVGPR